MVNRIEKEVLEAEYENWLLDETHKCERFESLMGDHDEKKRKEVEAWAKSYCGDCESALRVVREGRQGLI